MDEQILGPAINIANNIWYKIESPWQNTRFLSMESPTISKNSVKVI